MSKAAELRRQILEKLPEGTVVAEHTETAHFYRVDRADGRVFPSVTGKLQILKDEGLINYKMNRALEYVSVHRDEMVDPARAMQILDEASKESDIVLRDAGEIGTIIHDARERYFNEWIKTGERPTDLRRFIPPHVTDRRAIAGLRGVEKFCVEQKYQPVISELYVYDEEWETAGALDDIGLLGDQETIVLMDLKTSNRFKDHYFFQVAMYWHMFRKLTGITPERVLILKASKEDGSYKLEELSDLPRLAEYAGHMLKVNEALGFIKDLRKDNQRNVVTL